MNEVILCHLARTQALVETNLDIYAALMCSVMQQSEDETRKNIYANVDAKTKAILETLKKELQYKKSM